MEKNVQAGGRSAATPLNLGLAALVPPGEGLARQVLVDNGGPCCLQGYPLQTSKNLFLSLAVENQPFAGPSKPATLSCFTHIRLHDASKGLFR
jgi:hypothetical protein